MAKEWRVSYLKQVMSYVYTYSSFEQSRVPTNLDVTQRLKSSKTLNVKHDVSEEFVPELWDWIPWPSHVYNILPNSINT